MLSSELGNRYLERDPVARGLGVAVVSKPSWEVKS